MAGADFDEVMRMLVWIVIKSAMLCIPTSDLPITHFVFHSTMNHAVLKPPIRRIDADFTAIAGAINTILVDHVIYPELDGEIAAKHKNTMTPVVMSNLMLVRMAAHTADIA